MKKLLVLLVVALGVVGCKAIVKDMKKMNRVRKVALSACECKMVEAVKGYRHSNATMTFTLHKWWSEDHLATAENVLAAVKDSFPKICNFGEISIIFEHDEFDEYYVFYGCDFEPEIDTIYPSVDDGYSDDDWENFMDDADTLSGN